MAISHLETGFFVNANENYFSAPQQVNSAGDVQGHSHVVIEQISSLTQTTATDPTKFAFFKGLNDKAQNGVLSADVTSGLPAGVYRLSSINTAANHQPVLGPIAQHGSFDDQIYSRFLPSSFRIYGLVKAWEAASRAASGSSIVAGPSPPSERRVTVLKQTFVTKTPQAGLRTTKGLRTSRLTNAADTPGPSMPGRFPQTPCALDAPGECDTPGSDAFITPPQSNEDTTCHPVVPKTPESPTPQRDASVDPPPMFKLKLTADEPREKCENTIGAEAVATLTTLDSHLPSPPPTPPTDPIAKATEETENCAEPEPVPPPTFKIYQEMATQTDPVGVIVPMKRPKIAVSTSDDSLAPSAKKPHPDLPSAATPGTNLSKENLDEVKALLTSIESMDCVKGLTANLQQAKALLSEIASLDLLKNQPSSAAPPTLAQKDTSFVFLAPPAPPAPIIPKKLAASEDTDVEGDGDSQDEDGHAQPFRVPPNSLASGICEVTPSRDSGGRRPRSLVIKTGSDAWYLLKVPPERTEMEVANVRACRREVSAQYSERKMKVCRGFVIAELKSFHQNERKLRPVGSGVCFLRQSLRAYHSEHIRRVSRKDVGHKAKTVCRSTLPAAYNAQVRVPFEDPYTPHSTGTSDNSAVRRNPIIPIPAIHDAIEKHLALLRPDLFDRTPPAEVEVATPDLPAAAAPRPQPDWSKVPPAFKFF
ncbi:hypothetical protein EIP91_009490 [Steccherinum ochraceum]|uniref:Uncharacterized protein n=1 Tax=Steccherinum ochraceum TaxID=92696 RepID=A0A4R0R1M0_9APHY|nr:hypothetical protein EIP91_009490 [Steccherinum ochraceum]